MDPMSALGLAANIVQFVDFGSKLLERTNEIRKSASGQLEEHAELENITKNLARTSDEFELSIARDESRQLSSNDESIQAICRDSQVVANKLLDALNRLKSQGKESKWTSVVHALKAMWGQDEIDSLKRRLDGFRQQLIVAILVALREPVSALKHEQLEASSKMDHVAESNKMLGKQFLRHVSESKKWQADLIRAIQSEHRNDTTRGALTSELSSKFTGKSAIEFTRRILYQLRFRELPDRHERIAKAHRDTFEWVFKSPDETQGAWESFDEWLKNDSAIYWITGKPGSGKSTLMKFLFDDNRTSKILQASCADTEEIIIAGFFFWNSGTSMQMSQNGLIRTLLHDILKQCSVLAPVAFPDEWEAYCLFEDYGDEPWTWIELIRALKTTIKMGSESNKFLFLVDGLDEFSGNPTDLINLLSSLINQGNVKVCAASRPWVIFEDAFHHAPSLMLQDLTYPDIIHYVSTKLHDNAGFRALESEESVYASRIVDEVAKKSSGVFLWVSLVVHSLLTGITNGDRISDLQDRLDALPADLGELFTKILETIEPLYKKQACKLFHLVRAAKKPLTLLQMAFAETDNIDLLIDFPMRFLSFDEKESKAERMRRRLNSRCKGLLEPARPTYWEIDHHADLTVQYLHRTVRDYMLIEANWAKVVELSRDFYDPHIFLSASCFLDVKTVEFRTESGNGFLVKTFWDAASWCLDHSVLAVKASPTEVARAIRILDGLDNVAQIVTSRRPENGAPPLIEQSHVWEGSGIDSCWTACFKAQHGLERSDFFNLTVQCQIEWYVQEKIKRGYLAQRSHFLGSPLACAVNVGHYPKGDGIANLCHQQPSPTLVNLLLEAGMDPNQGKGSSLDSYPWQNVLSELARDPNNPQWIEIKKLFLKFGADPNESSAPIKVGADPNEPLDSTRVSDPADEDSDEVPMVASNRDDDYHDFPEVVTAENLRESSTNRYVSPFLLPPSNESSNESKSRSPFRKRFFDRIKHISK